ncbi:acyltransferase [Flavobacterium akiainvivens]|uniref:Acyltransferase n=1 Tax=Flavobacterium akiainvivens TaxID=1202724 RepID=A0A0N0RQV5_9FLAO|nr:acyltransferase [Flavobacterium akiainvivens]KOS07022.1 acyltransferase [Flavobacterium akiainvivens]SFQ59054.1 Peptidoglycan/LPS O-acetylase OafA/YrhL, contains acyltransferase and SGNH-hydrolase domains [Flavobacterium akiainvivens]
MSTTIPQQALPTKPHFAILDGLRGVAALMVVAFHVMETHAHGDPVQQIINHGYLAVDFFFLLSGYVMAYAYQDRWERMSVGEFFKRRLVRLQPMVVMGMIVGAIFFYFQHSEAAGMGKIADTPVWYMLVIMLIGFTLIPVPPSMDVRGWQEMHPLNGPGWSLFFEYVANILYALIVRRFSKNALRVLVVLSGIVLIHYAVTSERGDVIGGWSITAEQLRIGFTRVMFPFFAGLLLYRTTKITRINNAFLWCSLLIIAVLAFPRVGGYDHKWANGLYDSLSIIILFPIIVYMGASGQVHSAIGQKVCKFLGDISYPIYITHYPIIYTYTAYVANGKVPFGEALPWALVTFFGSIALAWLCLKLYDEPVRKWLKKKLG